MRRRKGEKCKIKKRKTKAPSDFNRNYHDLFLFKKKSHLFLFYVFGCLLVCMHVYCMSAWCLMMPEEERDFLELEL